MGYSTDFDGEIIIDPPLNEQEREFLTKFSETRRMDRENGPYFVDGDGFAGQDNGPDTVYDHNSPPPGQPGLWCNVIPNEDGTALVWTGNEKSYDMAEWMQYVIDHFLCETAIARSQLPFLQCNHVLNGEMSAQGEDPSDAWLLIVDDNQVAVQNLVYTTSGSPKPVKRSQVQAQLAPPRKLLT